MHFQVLHMLPYCSLYDTVNTNVEENNKKCLTVGLLNLIEIGESMFDIISCREVAGKGR